jgi:hypothetical protein
VRELIDATLGGLPYGKALGNVAAAFIIGFGVFAALDQLQVAEDIVRTAFQAVMFAIAGIAVVAVGGGGSLPCGQRWEQALNRIDEEAPASRSSAPVPSSDRAARAGPHGAGPVEPGGSEQPVSDGREA